MIIIKDVVDEGRAPEQEWHVLAWQGSLLTSMHTILLIVWGPRSRVQVSVAQTIRYAQVQILEAHIRHGAGKLGFLRAVRFDY